MVEKPQCNKRRKTSDKTLKGIEKKLKFNIGDLCIVIVRRLKTNGNEDIDVSNFLCYLRYNIRITKFLAIQLMSIDETARQTIIVYICTLCIHILSYQYFFDRNI